MNKARRILEEFNLVEAGGDTKYEKIQGLQLIKFFNESEQEYYPVIKNTEVDPEKEIQRFKDLLSKEPSYSEKRVPLDYGFDEVYTFQNLFGTPINKLYWEIYYEALARALNPKSKMVGDEVRKWYKDQGYTEVTKDTAKEGLDVLYKKYLDASKEYDRLRNEVDKVESKNKELYKKLSNALSNGNGRDTVEERGIPNAHSYVVDYYELGSISSSSYFDDEEVSNWFFKHGYRG